MVLVIDNSNTFTKLASADGRGVRAAEALAHPSLGLTADRLEKLADRLAPAREWDGLAFASVVPQGREAIRAFAAYRGLRVFELAWSNCGLDLSAHPDPSAVGPDRLADAVAGAARHPGRALVVVDCGTAATFNVVLPGDPPRFLGGAIAPGLGAFRDWLADRTALLPRAAVPEAEATVAAVGGTTEAAIRSALRHGFPGMAAAILDAQRAELARLGHPDPLVLWTGGDGALACAWTRLGRFEPGLTLDGIHRAASPHLSPRP